MAKLGTCFVNAKGLTKQRENEIKDFVKDLEFKKDIYVLIDFNSEVSDVLVDYRRLDYFITINPNMELLEIKKRLFEKGVLKNSETEHPNFKKISKLISLEFPKVLDKTKREELEKVLKIINFKINGKSFLDKIEIKDKNCLLYLNNFKDLIMYVLIEQLRWYIRTALLPKELKVSIESGKSFNVISKNDYFLGFNQDDIKAMNECRKKRQDIFNI